MKKRYSKKEFYHMALFTGVLLFGVISLGAYISYSDLQTIKIDEVTASYISFHNSDSTDMMKVSNLSRMSNYKGRSSRNHSYRDFEVLGEKKSRFQIVLYHIGTSISDDKIHFSLSHNKKEVANNTLNEMPEASNAGKIIYEGIIGDDNNWNLKMWIDNSYKDIKNVSYEIRIQ